MSCLGFNRRQRIMLQEEQLDDVDILLLGSGQRSCIVKTGDLTCPQAGLAPF